MSGALTYRILETPWGATSWRASLVSPLHLRHERSLLEARRPVWRSSEYSLAKIVGVWAAAADGFLARVCVPLLRDQLGGRDPFIESLLICLNLGLFGSRLNPDPAPTGAWPTRMVTRGRRSMASVAAQSENREDRRHGLAVGNSVRPTLRSDQCPASRPRRPVAEGSSRPSSEGSGPS